MTEVIRVVVECVDPVLESDGIRITSQVTEVLHRHETSVEKLIEYGLAFDHCPEDLRAGLLA
jgi:hypothetical protein